MRAITVVATVAALTAAAGLPGCGQTSSGSGSAANENGAATSAARMAAAGALAPKDAASAQLQLGPGQLPAPRSTVIQTGRLTVQIDRDRFSDATLEAGRIANELHGVVVSSDISKSRPRMATVVVRVPAAAFQTAMSDLSGVAGGSVHDVSFESEDVGQQFVDLAARRTNLRSQERVLRRLMDQAVTVTDTIRVQNQLSQVQGQIEEISGRLRYLHDQADLSTITLSLREAGAAPPGQPTAIGSAFRRGWDRAVSVVTAVIAGAGVVIPLALLAALALAAGLWLWPRLARRLGRSQPPAGDAA